MKYVVDEIEGKKAKLENIETKKTKTINVEEVPSIMEGDMLYFCDGVYVIDSTDKMERKTELRYKLNTLIDTELKVEDDFDEYL